MQNMNEFNQYGKLKKPDTYCMIQYVLSLKIIQA